MSSSGFYEDQRKLTGTGQYKVEEYDEEDNYYQDDFEVVSFILIALTFEV